MLLIMWINAKSKCCLFKTDRITIDRKTNAAAAKTYLLGTPRFSPVSDRDPYG